MRMNCKTIHHASALCLLYCSLAMAGDAVKDPVRPTGSEWPPVIGAWFWHDSTLEPDGYKLFLDAAVLHSPYTLLSTSLRVSKGEVIDPLVRNQIGLAVRYAHTLGLRVAFDLDIRLARQAFQSLYPEEQQEELVLKTVELPRDGTAEVLFEGRNLSDHMTGGTFPYLCLTTRLVRVYSFVRAGEGIDPETLRDITGDGVRSVADGPCKLKVTVPAAADRCACVIAAHRYLTPDVFAPHLIPFQREIVRQFADLPLAGLQKDEWGFPPDHTGNPGHDRYWYSDAMAKKYAELAPGRDLVGDTMLMFIGARGQERERTAAINRYRKMCRDRNVEIEDDYYRLGKEIFGPASVLVTHATWTPYPGAQEFRKNGLDWWEATRDIGQSDETAPYQCRTSLAKRWGFPLWYNQYYSSKLETYNRELWANVLGGGRVNFHPLYPRPKDMVEDGHLILMRQDLMIGLSRLRMLDFITSAPLDCPVAVIFGHACAMNWVGPSYNRVGLEIASALCSDGYPTDLIPSSLAGTTALRIDADGHACLGPQRYRAVILYQPEFGDKKELAFFRKIAVGKSAVFLVGDWTCDEQAKPLDAAKQLGGNVRKFSDDESCIEAVKRFLGESGVMRVTGWSSRVNRWGQPGGSPLASPPVDGNCILVDGTYIRIAGGRNPAGDPIVETFTWQGHTVSVDATGFVAIRFAQDRRITAFAAGGLKSVKTDGLDLALSERADLAFQTGSDGSIRGVVQGLSGPVPEALRSVTPDWQRLAVPSLLK